MNDEPPSRSDISKNRANLPKRLVAAAIENNPGTSELPKIIAAGRGKWAEQILELAYLNGIKVREDPALAEILANIELDSPIPTEAIMAVAEILAYVYEAEGKEKPEKDDPFRIPEKQLKE
jgi:flagellar biosynthesis protein